MGDVVSVEIDTDSSLSFRSSMKDAKSLSLEFSGGEFGNLLNFLPTASTGGNMSSQGEEKYSLKTTLVVRVSEIDPDGNLFIQGSRSVGIEGRQESISVSGWVDPRDLGPQRQIPFSRIADSRIVFRSLLEPTEEILRDEDIEEIVSEALEEAQPTDVSPASAELAGLGTERLGETLRLTDETRRELFLRYINRLIDIVFR